MGLGEEKEVNVISALSPEQHVKTAPILNSRWVHWCLLSYSPQFYGVCLTLQSRKKGEREMKRVLMTKYKASRYVVYQLSTSQRRQATI